LLNIKLQFFGQLRELVGKEEAESQVEEATRVEDLVWLTGERFPNIRKHLKHVSFSISNEYASKGTELKNNDEVGLLPPISGG